MSDQLLPCPFCGGLAEAFGTKWVGCASHDNCPGRGFICEPELWNRRAVDPDARKLARIVVQIADENYSENDLPDTAWEAETEAVKIARRILAAKKGEQQP